MHGTGELGTRLECVNIWQGPVRKLVSRTLCRCIDTANLLAGSIPVLAAQKLMEV